MKPANSDEFGGTGTRPRPAPPGSDHLRGNPLVTCLVHIGERLRRIDRDHVWVLDSAVVAAVFLLLCVQDLRVPAGGPSELAHGQTVLPWPATLALQATLVLPLLWRRRYPSATFAVIAGSVLLLRLWSLELAVADFAPYIAAYGLGLYGRLKHLPWFFAALVAGGAMTVAPFSATTPLGSTLLIMLSLATAPVALGLVVRFRRAELAGLRERAVRLEVERDQRSRLAAAAERARVAREMHDIVGHNLSVIVTLADGGAYAAEGTPERGEEALRLIGDTGRQALDELRRTLNVLRERTDDRAGSAELSPQPGITDVDALCAHIRAAGLEVVLRTDGDLRALDPGVQLAVYRIVQEALTNSLKHAGPGTRVLLTLTRHGPTTRVLAEDTGRPGGSGRTVSSYVQGHGLAGMRERAALYGGTMSAGPRPGGGWRVRATLDHTPVAQGAAS